jgi:nitrogenase molybdenum-iron protein NifN
MYQDERGRLVDSYVDAHKYVFEKRAVLYGEEDFVLAMASFLREIGIVPVLCASGAGSSLFKSEINKICDSRTTIIAETDFETIAQYSRELKPDIIIGNSKGYYIARELGIPIVRCGFPIHDRIGGQRVLHVGYRGTQMLFDTIVNSLLQYKQDKSAVGYKYM